MDKVSELIAAPAYWRRILSAVAMGVLLCGPRPASAGEGGTSHVLPGANATLVDLPPTTPGIFFKPMVMGYDGTASVLVPTAAGIASNLEAKASTLVLGGGYTFETPVLGGAHYSVAAFLPYTWLDVSGSVQLPFGTVERHTKVNGLGDMTVVPVMLAWKLGDWQLDALMPIYAPTGGYEQGRLGNPGLNYWTFDPMLGVNYLNKKVGFNALLHAGFAMNTENPDTDYHSGNLVHLDGALEQLLRVGSGYLTLGVEGFYFQQVACDSGSGAVLGCFKGRTAGGGPLIGYIQPLGQNSLSVELKWLAETDTKNRLEGDWIWLKMVYKF